MSAQSVIFPVPNEPTVAELVAAYLDLEGPALSPRSLAMRRRYLSRFATKYGACLPSRLHKSDLTSWLRGQTDWRADDTKRAALISVKRCFSWAVDDERISRHPFAKVSWAESEPRRSLTDGEFRAGVRHSQPFFRPVLFFLRHVGCRPCEMASLEWPMVDWAKAIALLPKHKTAKKSKKPRILYLTPLVVRFLRVLYRRRVPELGERVFMNSRGGIWTDSQISQRWIFIRKRAGLPNDAKIYGLRHALANRSQAAGNDIRTTADLLGHASTRTTERYYLHKEERRGSLIEAARRAMGGGPPGTG